MEKQEMMIAKGTVVKSYYDGDGYNVKIEIDPSDKENVVEYYSNVNWNKRFTPDILNDSECNTISMHSNYDTKVFDENNNPISFTGSKEIIGTVEVGTKCDVAFSANKRNTCVYPRAFKFYGYTQREIEDFNPFKGV